MNNLQSTAVIQRSPHIERPDPFPIIIGLFALLSAGRVWFLRDGIWDDNTWLFSTYFTDSLQEYLSTGFTEMRRNPVGTFFYYLFLLHKNTDYFYAILHTVDLTSLILCPIILYRLLCNMFSGRQPLAFLVAMCLSAFPLDHTLPYVSAVNYRISLPLSLISLLATERAMRGNRVNYVYLSLALITAGISHYVFLDARVALEPARLLIIWLSSSRANSQVMPISLPLLRWLPFMVLALPLAYYKHAYKPYGLYEQIYSFDPLFLFNKGAVWGSLKDIWNYHRRELLQAMNLANGWAVALGASAVGLSFIALRHLQTFSPFPNGKYQTPLKSNTLIGILEREWHAARIPLLLGTALFVPPAALSMYAHLPFVGEQHNTHASLIQVGSACIMGAFLHLLYSIFPKATAAVLIRICLAALLGFGVFVNNKYLDLYVHSWEEQSRFLSAFVARFPSLPDRAVFFFDARTNALFTDLRNPIDFELPLNLLYATSKQSGQFRRYLASTPDEFRAYHPENDRWAPLGNTLLTRRTRWGIETLATANLIVVRYRDGELLVNREILQRYPNIEYKAWLDKDFPSLPPSGQYVLRKKVEGPARE